MRALRFLPLVLLIAFTGCDSSDDAEIEIETIVEGEGTEAVASSTVTVDYVGRLTNGTVFDQGERAEFPLDRAIEGFRDGIVGMRVGGQRRITIPPELAYGESGQGPVPPNATLIFDVTLLDVE